MLFAASFAVFKKLNTDISFAAFCSLFFLHQRQLSCCILFSQNIIRSFLLFFQTLLTFFSGFIDVFKRYIYTLYLFFFFFLSGFFHGHWQLTGQQDKGGDLYLFHSTTSTRSRTFRHLCATLHVRWLSHIFNCNACIYQAATRWDLPPWTRIDYHPCITSEPTNQVC